MRDTAALLDALGGPAPGRDRGRRPRCRDRWRTRWAPDPGRLRIGLCIQAFNGADVDGRVPGRRRRRRHSAGPAGPRGRGAGRRRPCSSPTCSPGRARCSRCTAAAALDAWSPALGRALGEADVEPHDVAGGRAGAEPLSGAEALPLLARQQELSRQVLAWWADGAPAVRPTVTPATAEPAPPLGALQGGPTSRAAPARSPACSTPPANRLCRCPSAGRPMASRVACSSSPRTAARMSSSASAAQLEADAPWAHRRPPTHA